ncbi:MAG TPA: copper-binding protein [Candidatus Nitrosotalea sp.]|nr:copper-binding protein [Candidatus Nitrosotalea sp.]
MRAIVIVLALACMIVITCGASAHAVSFNCVPYFKAGPPSPQTISNLTQIPNATQEEWWLVDCKAIPVTLSTDKLSYESGDTIVASGTAINTPAGIVMGIKVVAPNGNIVRVDQATVGSDGTFTTTIVSGGALWQQAGMYTVEAQQVNTQKSASSEFYFSGPPTVPFISSVLVNNTNMSLPYTIVNGNVASAYVNTYMRSLIITFQAHGKGALTINLPRTLIDSKGANQTDLDFVVTSDGKAPAFEETRNATTRDLVIPFEANMTQIRVIGTQVVPEFGPAPILVLAALIVTVIAMGSARLGSLNHHKAR